MVVFRDTTVIQQKGTKRFRCTTADGTETLTPTSVVLSQPCWTVLQLLVQIVQAEHTLQIKSQDVSFIVGALGTGSSFAVGDRALLVASCPNIKR